MSFIRTYATKSMFSPHNMVCRHISKLHSENHDLGIIIFFRKPLKYLPPSRNFIPKLLIITGYIYVHWIRGVQWINTVIMVLDKIKKCPIFILKINIAYVLLMYMMKQSYFILNDYICDRTCCNFHGCISFYKYVSTIASEIVAKTIN